jgi:hypothetical protein
MKHPVVLAVLLLLLSPPSARAAEVVTIEGSGDLGPFPGLVSGFLHGIDEQGALDSAAVAPLDPAFWRIYKYVTYDLASGFEAGITYELGTAYAMAHGGFPNARPWEDWAGWEQYVANRVASINYWFPDDKAAFYDIWNEPDLPYFWSGTYAQLLELFARAHAAVKSVDPNAKLVGPSAAKYVPGASDAGDVVQFARDLDQYYGVRLDALAWHENDSGVFGDAADMPEDIPGHAAWIRSGLAASFPPEYQPELHVNEYGGNRVHLSPGYCVGYLYYLMEAGVSMAARSCWTVYSGDAPPYATWSDCWSGLNGMFMNDGRTPQIIYWVYEAAARMRGGVRLPATSPTTRLNVLASRIDADEEIRLLVGRHQVSNAPDVVLRVEGWPWADTAVRVEAARIPHFAELFHDPPKAIPWPNGPVDGWTGMLPVVDGAVEVSLGAFSPNDAWSVSLTRNPAAHVSEIDAEPAMLAIAEVSPNPFTSSAEVRFAIPAGARVCIDVFDVSGRRLSRLLDARLAPGSHSVAWSGIDAEGQRVGTGIYFFRLTDGRNTDTAKIIRCR